MFSRKHNSGPVFVDQLSGKELLGKMTDKKGKLLRMEEGEACLCGREGDESWNLDGRKGVYQDIRT